MKNKIIIVNEENYDIKKILNKLETETLSIEIIEITSEDLNIVKSVINRNNEEENSIAKLLELIGVPNDKIGYKYIVDAILLWNKYMDINKLNITFIYKKIAIKYNKNIFSIEKAIRKCIEHSFTYGNLKELNKLFSIDISSKTGKINNKKFISKIAQYINREKN